MRALFPLVLAASLVACGPASTPRAATPVAAARTTISPADQALRARIDAIVQAYHARGELDGVVLVARGDTVIYAGAVGLASRAWDVPSAVDTVFPIASITKQITAVLVLQLVEQGKLHLDETVAEALPGYRKDTGAKITLRHLLTHSSGLPNLDDAPGFYQSDDPANLDPKKLVAARLSGDLVREPGVKFEYNNADYLLLGAILEQQTGLSFERLVHERVLAPLGMKHSGMLHHDVIVPRLAEGYEKRDAGVGNATFIRYENFGAAGGMYSTAEDLLAFDRALDAYRLLSKASLAALETPDPRLGYVALGAWVYQANLAGVIRRPRFVERQGAIGGYATLNLRAPDDGIRLIVLSNVDTADLHSLYMGGGLPAEVLRALYDGSR
jgi:CubicO group peptidase (beta-lactamase class C family)